MAKSVNTTQLVRKIMEFRIKKLDIESRMAAVRSVRGLKRSVVTGIVKETGQELFKLSRYGTITARSLRIEEYALTNELKKVTVLLNSQEQKYLKLYDTYQDWLTDTEYYIALRDRLIREKTDLSIEINNTIAHIELFATTMSPTDKLQHAQDLNDKNKDYSNYNMNINRIEKSIESRNHYRPQYVMSLDEAITKMQQDDKTAQDLIGKQTDAVLASMLVTHGIGLQTQNSETANFNPFEENEIEIEPVPPIKIKRPVIG